MERFLGVQREGPGRRLSETCRFEGKPETPDFPVRFCFKNSAAPPSAAENKKNR